jgi:hypothetical protein
MAECKKWLGNECVEWDAEGDKIIMNVKSTCPAGLREALIKHMSQNTRITVRLNNNTEAIIRPLEEKKEVTKK